MADNVQLDKNTTTGAIIAADAVVVGTTTQYHQRVKLSIGTSGSASDVHSGNPLPVTIPGSVSVTGGPIIVHVSGVVSVSPSGAFYIITPTGTSLPVRVSGTVAIAEPITISGTVGLRADFVDEATFTAGSDRVIAIGARFGTDVVGASGDIGIIRMTSGRVLLVTGISPAGATAVNIGAEFVDEATFTLETSRVVAIGARFGADVVGAAGDVGVIRMTSGRVLLVTGISGSGVVHTDDAAFTPATDDIVPFGAYFASVTGTPDQVNIGDAGVVRMTSGRILLVGLSTTSGGMKQNIVRVSGNVNLAEPITISGSITNITNAVSVKATGTALVVKVSVSVTIVEPVTISGSVSVSGMRADRASFTKGTSEIIPIGGYFV